MGDMRKRTYYILFGLLIYAVLIGLLILSTIISANNMEATRQATIHAIYLTNTAFLAELDPCHVIAYTLMMSHVCDNEYDFFWTQTPSPANPSLPTSNQIRATGTANQPTQQTYSTVLAACATLQNSWRTNIAPCPMFGATSTAAAQQNTIPTNTPTPSVR
jgi:hypothetical protein